VKNLTTKAKVLVITATTFLILLFTLMPQAAAAGSITLTPSTQAPGGTVTVTGTGFGASKAIGIGIGSEITVTGEAHTPTGTGTGPWMTRTNYYPIKPGSFSFHSNVVDGAETDFTDKGDGTMSTTSAYDAGSYLNYVPGTFGRSSTMDLSSSTVIFTAAYKYYQYNATPAGNPNSTASGTFSLQITVPPGLANGNYNVTAIDAVGNTATTTLTVNVVIPEELPLSGLLLVSSAIVIVSLMYFRKRPKNVT
jgi:hypothetical protein